MCIASLLNRHYLQVSGSVRVRRGIVGRLGLGLGLVLVLRLGLGLALGLQLGIGIGFRHNHSWSSTFMPRHNHSLCLSFIAFVIDIYDTCLWPMQCFIVSLLSVLLCYFAAWLRLFVVAAFNCVLVLCACYSNTRPKISWRMTALRNGSVQLVKSRLPLYSRYRQ